MRDDRIGGPVRWRLHLNAPPERVFAALDTDNGRAAFWAESAVERDGVIDFRFVNGVTTRSRILERDAPRIWALDYMGGTARFVLTPDGSGGTDLELTHGPIPDAEWIEVHAGWLNVLFPMKAWVCHGIDLRNHDPARTWGHGYVDQ